MKNIPLAVVACFAVSFFCSVGMAASTDKASTAKISENIPAAVQDVYNAQAVQLSAGINRGAGFIVDAQCHMVSDLKSVILNDERLTTKSKRRKDIELLLSIGVATRPERNALIEEMAGLNEVLDLYTATGIPKQIQVTFTNGDDYKAKLLGIDQPLNLAFLKLERQHCSVGTHHTGKGLKQGDSLFAISPDKINPVWVTGSYFTEDKLRFLPIETDTASGMNGLVDAAGQFVGVKATVSVEGKRRVAALGVRSLNKMITDAAESGVIARVVVAEPSLPKQQLSDQQIEQQLSACIDNYLHNAWLKAYSQCDIAAQRFTAAQFVKAEITVNGAFHHGKEAVALYEAAASKGYGDASYRLAQLYLEGSLLSKDREKALSLIEQACEHQSAEACQFLANRKLTVHRYAEALPYLQKSEGLGGIAALIELGDMYRRGRALEKDTRKAMDYYLRAANLGSNEAQYAYAMNSYKGLTGKTNYKTAYTWLLVSEIDQIGSEDKQVATQWSKQQAADKRFEIGRMLSTVEKQQAHQQALQIVKRIRQNLMEHRKQLLSRRPSQQALVSN